MAKKLAYLFGIIFILVGVLGFFSNPIVGADGFFGTDTIHNLVHLIVGIVLVLVAAYNAAASSTWLKVFGVIYVILALIGFFTVPNGGMLLGIVGTNSADHILHAVLGIVLLIAGMTTSSDSMS